MTGEFVEKIREAEKEVLQRKKEAVLEGKALVEEAHAAGERLLAKAEAEAAGLATMAAIQDREKAEEKLSRAKAEGERQVQVLREEAAGRLDAAAEAILEGLGVLWQ